MGKQVKTPRFYVDIPTFLHAVGYGESFGNNTHGLKLLYMNPSNQNVTSVDDWGFSGAGNTNSWYTLARIGRAHFARTEYPINFMALLNHNYGYATSSDAGNGKIKLYAKSSDIDNFDNNFEEQFTEVNNILNSNCQEGTSGGPAVWIKPEYNGSTIFSFKEKNAIWSSFSASLDITENNNLTGYVPDVFKESATGFGLGSMVVGKYWDAPNSPDLSLTMSRRFEGIKTKKTMGGKVLSNIYYDGPTEWTMHGLKGDPTQISDIRKYPCFELDWAGSSSTANQLDGQQQEMGKGYYKWRAKSGLGRKGLRSWNLTFSYISEDNMWMAYEHSSVTPFDRTTTTNSDATYGDVPQDDGVYVSSYDQPDNSPVNPMLNDDSFNFVWNCTLGGTLPFIFQPDKTNKNPDQFSICTFNQKTLSVQQVAYNTYTLSVTIDEVA